MLRIEAREGWIRKNTRRRESTPDSLRKCPIQRTQE
jgi:hypothetical protein